MPLPWTRKRTVATTATAPALPAEEGEVVQLSGEEHAWWTQREVTEVWKPKPRLPETPEQKRDILAEHFGDDWRTNFGYTPASDEALAEASRRDQQALDDADPYLVLGVDAGASWDDIVAAHRDMARLHHPDRLFGQSDGEKEAGEDRIRVINTAYQELRIRRGK